MTRNVSARVYEIAVILASDPDAFNPDDALSHLDADDLHASKIDCVAYMECDLYANLDDEIESIARFKR